MITFHSRSRAERLALSPMTPELLYETAYQTKIAFFGKLFTDTKHKTFMLLSQRQKTMRMTIIVSKRILSYCALTTDSRLPTPDSRLFPTVPDSLSPKALHRIGDRRFNGLKADSKQRDQ